MEEGFGVEIKRGRLALLRDRVEEKEKKHPILTMLQQHKQRRNQKQQRSNGHRQYQQYQPQEGGSPSSPSSSHRRRSTTAVAAAAFVSRAKHRADKTSRSMNQGKKKGQAHDTIEVNDDVCWVPAAASSMKKSVQESKEDYQEEESSSEDRLRITVVTATHPPNPNTKTDVVADEVDSQEEKQRHKVAMLEGLLNRRERNITELKEHYEKALKENHEAWQAKYKLALDDAKARLKNKDLLMRRLQEKGSGAFVGQAAGKTTTTTTPSKKSQQFACHDFWGGKILACTISMDVDEDSVYGDESTFYDETTYDGSYADESLTSSRQSLQDYLNLRVPWLAARRSSG